MTDFLVRHFVKDYENTEDNKVREHYGMLSSIVGIFCNVALFILKYIFGTISNSISIISDAFNNLSDSASCIVTFLGYKLAAKPADKDHPFGHGRMEYLTALSIAVIIMLVGIELLKSSVDKILHPEEIIFSVWALISLIVSICVKLWMSFFNTKLGRRINSSVMEATAQDSRNDVIATSAAAIALIASIFTDLPVDGIMGVIVSVFVLKGGFGIIKDTVDDLLGKPADNELSKKIAELVLSKEHIIGIHDLVIHNYGPGNLIASCHVEVRSDENFVAVHDIVDGIEREIHTQLGVMMTIHMDPIDMDDEQVNSCREMIRAFVKTIDSRLHIHDFRMVSGETHTNVIFDLVVPYDCKLKDTELKSIIDGFLDAQEKNYFSVITFDREFVDR
ncbi:MAG: cation diffusion facilitator family transporter [Huintestinicola sp.]